MAKSHAVLTKAPQGIVQQAQHNIDVNADYDLIVKVRDGVVHTYANNVTKEAKPCIECTRYSNLLAQRERDSYPNITE